MYAFHAPINNIGHVVPLLLTIEIRCMNNFPKHWCEYSILKTTIRVRTLMIRFQRIVKITRNVRAYVCMYV